MEEKIGGIIGVKNDTMNLSDFQFKLILFELFFD